MQSLIANVFTAAAHSAIVVARASDPIDDAAAFQHEKRAWRLAYVVGRRTTTAMPGSFLSSRTCTFGWEAGRQRHAR